MPGDPPCVLITARNEADRVAETVAALREAFGDASIVVVDDASTDDTAAVAERSGAEVVRAPRRLGKGGAATLAAERLVPDPPLVVLADGDLGASAGELRKLVALVERGEADMAVAVFARRLGGGFGLALGAANWVIGRRTGRRLEAPLSGQRAIAPGALAALVPFAPGFGMETAMAVDAHRAGLRTAEVELDLEHRATGRTAAGFRHRGRQLLDILRVYVSRR